MSSTSSSRSIRKVSMVQAAAMLIKLGVKTSTELALMNKEKRRPVEIPSRPDLYYKDEFQDWKTFFKIGENALKNGIGIDKCPSFSEVKALILQKEITTKQDFKKAIKDGRLPALTPPFPEQFYEDEWTDWKEFLAPKAFYISFDEARKIARGFGFKNAYQWTTFCREGKLAEFIPKSPDREYDEFTTWEDFLIDPGE